MVVAIGNKIGKRQRVGKVYICVTSCLQEPSMYIDCKYNVRKAHHQIRYIFQEKTLNVNFEKEELKIDKIPTKKTFCLLNIQGSHPFLVHEQDIN